MATIAAEILLILLLLCANGLFAMAEIAVVSARRVRLQHRAAQGDAGAHAALQLANAPNDFLATVQIGITLIGILAGAFGGATLAKALASGLNEVPGLAPYSEIVAFGIVVLVITYLSVVLGELVPKRLALTNPEGIAATIALPMRKLAVLAAPIVRLLSGTTDLLLRAFGIRPAAEPQFTEDEILLLLGQAQATGVVQAAEEVLMQNVLRLGDRRVDDLMTPRPKVVTINREAPTVETWQTIAASTHAYFPVWQGNPENIVGLASIKRLWVQWCQGSEPTLDSALVEPLFVLDSTPALKLLEQFQASGAPLALIVDEYGAFLGIVTPTDVLETIVGTFAPTGSQDAPTIVRRTDGSWLIDGTTTTAEIKDALAISAFPEEEIDSYRTLGGFIMAALGHIPMVGEVVTWQGYRFEVVDMDGRRVDQVLVQSETPQQTPSLENTS